MFHSYDYISLFGSCFDIPVGLGHLFQWIAPVYDRLYLSCLDKVFEEIQMFGFVFCHYGFLLYLFRMTSEQIILS